jgi:hypothetical protein
MTNLLNTFISFLADEEASEMYIVGVAGTGKTISLGELIEYCNENKITTVTCAFTHKAVKVLASKLPKQKKYNKVQTLHSYLKKVPTINDKATEVQHVDGNARVGISEVTKVIFIDEFSMVGEKDYVDINTTQWSEVGKLLTKAVYIGDPNQLPPVKDVEVITPKGKYRCYLTKIHRQEKDNPLIDTLMSINGMIDGEKPKPLVEHSNFIRGKDIVDLYRKCKTSKVLLAYTNEKVQSLNAELQGRSEPKLGDEVFVSTLRYHALVTAINDRADEIRTIKNEKLALNSKYNTLETLHLIDGIQFYDLQDENLNTTTRAVVFGHRNYLDKSDELAREAVKYNRVIEKQFKMDPTQWAKANYKHELAKKRSDAWKKYLSFKYCVICVDFPHALTVHKSQGSTYENVFLDMKDLGKCADKNYDLYLRLMYVAVSRASDKVYTN